MWSLEKLLLILSSLAGWDEYRGNVGAEGTLSSLWCAVGQAVEAVLRASCDKQEHKHVVTVGLHQCWKHREHPKSLKPNYVRISRWMLGEGGGVGPGQSYSDPCCDPQSALTVL